MVFVAFLLLFMILWGPRQTKSDNLVFYSPSARAVIPVEAIGEVGYLPLIPVLNAVGKVGALQEKKNSLRVWFEGKELEILLDERRVRVDKKRLSLAAPVRRARGQWAVPLDFLTVVLPQLSPEPISFRRGGNRVYIGGVRPGSFSVQVEQIAEGARLTLEFSDRVSMRTAASDGKWVVFLGSQPLEPRDPLLRAPNPYLKALEFDDRDGVPKLIVTPAAGDLNFYPKLGEDGKSIVAEVRPPATPRESPQGSETGATPTAELPPGQEPGEAGGVEAPSLSALPAIVLDAGHGGADAGARSRDGVLEKDLAAQLVARVRLAVLSGKKYRVILTRSGDLDVPFDQRSATANWVRPVAFVSFHAGDLGAATPRLAVYTYRPSQPQAESEKGGPQRLFVVWTRAQELHLEQSHRLAQAVQARLAAIPGVTTDAPAQAPVRILRSINAPAVAIEIGSLTPDEDAGSLTNPAFLQQVAGAIAQGLSEAKP